MTKDTGKTMRTRITIIQVVVILMLFAVGAKSFDIQIFKSKKLARMAEQDYSRHLVIKGERGQILDRHMNKLATSTVAYAVTASPDKIDHPEKAARQLAKILDKKTGWIEKRLSGNRKFAWLARRISPDQADQVRALGIPGIHIDPESKRFYPNLGLAAQVLGFTGLEDNGLEGLEFQYNKDLEGKDIKIRIKRDRNGRLLDLANYDRSRLRGKSIMLTLDKRIQFFSENALEQAVRQHEANSGLAVVMRPETGEVLAIAHYPGFNPNNFGQYERATYRNRAVTDAFEPGSAMKIFTAAAALEKGFSPRSIFFCENGDYRIGTYTVHDTHPHEWLSINQIIKVSSNIGAVKIVQTIGEHELFSTLRSFGFGEKTYVGAPGETSGTLSHYHRWSKIDAGAISFGQGMSVSAMQLVSAVSAIANNGLMMRPFLIREIISNDGTTARVNHPEPIGQIISQDTAGKIKKMMNLVVQEDGTGSQAAMEGYQVCGKTGTAQKVREDGSGYSSSRYTAVFTGFAPLKDPQLAVLVVVDEPQGKYYGGEVAAPAFKEILAESFNYLNIAPDEKKNTSMIALANERKQQ